MKKKILVYSLIRDEFIKVVDEFTHVLEFNMKVSFHNYKKQLLLFLLDQHQ